MADSPTKRNKIIVTGISIAIGYGIKQLMKKFWVYKYREGPPGLKESENLQWGKLLLWTLMTGMILRVVKVAIKRSLTIAIKKNNLLT
jgi:hypothetical protein